jgi:hypothetical protein
MGNTDPPKKSIIKFSTRRQSEKAIYGLAVCGLINKASHDAGRLVRRNRIKHKGWRVSCITLGYMRYVPSSDCPIAEVRLALAQVGVLIEYESCCILHLQLSYLQYSSSRKLD